MSDVRAEPRRLPTLSAVALVAVSLGFHDPAAAPAVPRVVRQEGESKFDPSAFMLRDLVADLEQTNHFQLPPKAQDYVRRVLADGHDFKFTTHDQKGTYAFITPDMQKHVRINLAHPRKRLGRAICHELLHWEDFQQFKPINRLSATGLTREQRTVFFPQVGELVNMLSHEQVKLGLATLGFDHPMREKMEATLKGAAAKIAKLEQTFVPISKQLAAQPGKEFELSLGGVEGAYHELLRVCLRDELLFAGKYRAQADPLCRRLQAVLDFVRSSTTGDPGWAKVHRDVPKVAAAIRTRCRAYHATTKTPADRYALLNDTFGHAYAAPGLAFRLDASPDGAAPKIHVTSTKLEAGAPFLLDGKFRFRDVTLFTPYRG